MNEFTTVITPYKMSDKKLRKWLSDIISAGVWSYSTEDGDIRYLNAQGYIKTTYSEIISKFGKYQLVQKQQIAKITFKGLWTYNVMHAHLMKTFTDINE